MSFILDFLKLRIQFFFTLFERFFPSQFTIKSQENQWIYYDSDPEDIPKQIPRYGQKKVYTRIVQLQEEELSGAVWPRMKGKNGIRS